MSEVEWDLGAGCELRIEVIVKMQKYKSWGSGQRGGREVGDRSGSQLGIGGRGFGDVNQKLKGLLKVHRGIVHYCE